MNPACAAARNVPYHQYLVSHLGSTNDRRRPVTNDVGAVLKSLTDVVKKIVEVAAKARKELVLRLEYAPASVPVKMLLTSPARASPSVLSSTPARSVFRLHGL
ncbi:hypothetical protein BGY98DRAFT_1182074 [Russula aff. rugulosa BPL654]|nr:hypothetical protein BGY98DRAFT_1182074 [Russula aff. rugulosa BPL654]